MFGFGIWDLFQIGGLTALELNEMFPLHAYITQASGNPATKCSVSEFSFCIVTRKNIGTGLAKVGADLIRLKANEYNEMGLRLGISDGRNETKVYRRREYTGSKKVRPVPWKSRITTRINKTALGRHTFCLRKSCAGDASGLSFPGQALRPCSLVIRQLYGLRNEEMKRIK
jgi:hypothetical protein